MISISNCFRLKLAPEHFLRPLTAMSDRLCPGELKCYAIGKPPGSSSGFSVLLDVPKMFAESFA